MPKKTLDLNSPCRFCGKTWNEHTFNQANFTVISQDDATELMLHDSDKLDKFICAEYKPSTKCECDDIERKNGYCDGLCTWDILRDDED